MKRAILTVIGKDIKGIIASVSGKLFERGANILDISQTLLDEFFTMVMLVDLSGISLSYHELKEELIEAGAALNVSVNMQREELFDAMNKV
jgi:ACT domain-containing protein